MTLLLALAVALPGTHFPGVLVQGGFVTPSGNIACNVGRLGPGTHGPFAIGCAVFSRRIRGGGIATWWMGRTGRARFGTIVANPATDYPTLAYGRAHSWRGIRCLSARAGLTCRNLSRHGFFLSRERQRIF